MAGTEEGHIHKCSCSYNEQYLDTYKGHKVSLIVVVIKNLFCNISETIVLLYIVFLMYNKFTASELKVHLKINAFSYGNHE